MSERRQPRFGLGPIAVAIAALGLIWVVLALPVLGESVNWGVNDPRPGPA